MHVKIVHLWKFNNFEQTKALNIPQMLVIISCKMGTLYSTIIMQKKYIVLIAYRYTLPNILSFWVNIFTFSDGFPPIKNIYPNISLFFFKSMGHVSWKDWLVFVQCCKTIRTDRCMLPILYSTNYIQVYINNFFWLD